MVSMMVSGIVEYGLCCRSVCDRGCGRALFFWFFMSLYLVLVKGLVMFLFVWVSMCILFEFCILYVVCIFGGV